MTDRFYHQSFAASFDYPVVFTQDLFDPANRAFVDAATRLGESQTHRAIVFIDSGVVRHHADLPRWIQKYFEVYARQMELATPPRVVPGGEAIKQDLKRIDDIIRQFVELRLCRHSIVVAIGGGAVLDAIGFATALFHRGLRLIRVPTTVLAQNDVAVGVKNAMNFSDGKNLVGTFNPPFAVLNDFNFLLTLSDHDWIAGISEAFKVAIIQDADFFETLCRSAKKLCARDKESMEHLIRRCAELHLEHIRTSGDPFEYGRARPLDFGHWSAHKLESMSGYRIGHGHAVAIGIALDSCYATRQGWLTEKQFQAVWKGLTESGFTLWSDELERRSPDGKLEILEGLKNFQEHLGGELYITFPKGIGRKFEAQEVDAALIEECIRGLKKWQAGPYAATDSDLAG
jgi:3-dehydroquinate synthase